MIISAMNLKGGVGKTTSIFYLWNHLPGKKLLLDVTSETNLTSLLLAGRNVGDKNVVSFLSDRYKFNDVVVKLDSETDFIPGTKKLGDLEKRLGTGKNPELILKTKLEKYLKRYTFCLIDCPPHLSIILRAVMILSDKILIPVAMERQAIRDAQGILENVKAIENSKLYGKDIDVSGCYILPTMKKKFDKRGNKSYRYLLTEFNKELILPAIPFCNQIRDSIDEGTVIEKGRGHKQYNKIAEVLI